MTAGASAVNVTTFANNPSTTIAVNGYAGSATADAPAALTQESWTVSSSSAFPAASSTSIPTTGFHVADPAAPSELILVTNVSGVTWTVTRGVESTTPVTHAAGATFYQIVSAGDLLNFKQSPGATTTPVTVTSTTETVLASYQPDPTTLAAGATWEIIAFGPLSCGGTSTKSAFQFALYWGGSGAVGGTYTIGSGHQLAFIKTGVNSAANNTTIVAGNSWDLNGSITYLSATTATANMNCWYSQAITTTALNSTTVNSGGGAGASSATAITISGTGPIFLTGVWTSVVGTCSLTATAPAIYRMA